MRKIYLLFLILIALQKSFAQTNTFPTSGNVGIGTTSPTYPLDIYGSTQRIYNTIGAAYLRIEGTGLASYTGSYIYLGSANTRAGDTFTKARIDANRGVDSTTSFQLSRMNGETYSGLFYRYDDPYGHRFLTAASRTATTTGEAMRISPEGSVGIGGTGFINAGLRVGRSILDVSPIGIKSDGQIQANVPDGFYFRSDANRALSGSATSITHYFAGQSAIGTVTNQMGFSVNSSLVGATNNYGFFGNIPAGTGRWNMYMAGTANNFLNGKLGMGTTSLDATNLSITLPLTGSTNFNSLYNFGTIQSDVTGLASYFRSSASTQASAFNLTSLIHYGAFQGTIGASSSVTNQFGVYVDASMIGATNNYGVYSAIPAGTGRWNLYLAGAANNFLAGRLGIGATNLSDRNLSLALPLTGATTHYAFLNGGVVQTDVTSSARYFNTIANVAPSANVTDLIHFIAESNTFGAGSTVTHQTGFYVPSSLSAATNNYAFRGNLAAGTGRWNLYMAGTANNFLEGNLGIGTGMSSPNAPLQFENALANRIIVLNEGANNDHQFYGLGINSSMLRFQIAGTGGAYGFYAATGASASNEVARITGTGRLGIGTTAPISAIHLNGASGNAIITLQRPTAASSAIGALGFANGANNYLSGVTSTYGTDSTQASLSFRVGTPNGNVYSVPERMRIDKDGNVGIGTSNPQTKLEVSGATNTSGLRFTNLTSASTPSAANGKVLTVNSTGDVVLADNGGSMTTSDLNTYKTYYTESLMANATTPRRYEIARIFTDVAAWSATSPVEIELDEIYYGTGVKRKYQVLFGYPDSYKLVQTDIYTAGATSHNNFQLTVGTPEVISGTIKYLPIYVDLRNYGRVRALIKTGRALNASSTSGTGGTIYIDTNPTPTTIAEFTADNTVSFANGAATTLLTGNVGIGVVAPTKRLELGGTRPTAFDSNNGTIKMKGDAGGWAMNYGFKGSSDTDWGGLWGLGGADALTQWSIGKVYTDNFLVVKSTGFVGVGTSTPASELHVNGDITLSSDGVTASSIKPSVSVNGTARTLRFDYSSSSATEGFQFYNSNSSSNLMMIQGNGNVGVGTSAPTALLHVEKGIAGNYVGLFKNTDTGTSSNGLRVDVANASATNTIQRWYAADAEVMRVQADGKVALGVTSAVSKLHVAANATAINAVQTIETIGAGGRPYSLYKAEGGNYGYVGYGINASDVMSVFNYKNAALQFGTNSATRMTIDNTGGVVVGTSTSNGSLLVKGNASIFTIEGTDHSYMQFYPQTYAGGRKAYLGFPNAGATTMMLTNEFTNGAIRLRNNNIDAININSLGQVGINTLTVPADYKLAVAGNIIAEKVKVKKQSSGWPDYVFNEEYKLLSLKEVEQFTRENKHLPEIPSAKEIEKEWQDIGEMNRLLLKKVEELTLYVIELKKDNERQDQEIKQLKKHKK